MMIRVSYDKKKHLKIFKMKENICQTELDNLLNYQVSVITAIHDNFLLFVCRK